MKYLITGATGSLGQAVTKILINDPSNTIVGYSRDEQKQRLLDFGHQVVFYLGDIRDRDRILEASRGVETIFHFAALKCVDTLELNPEECIDTNINGTRNVLHAQRLNKIKRVVFTSTDKAVEPINIYGYCKAVSEKLVLRNRQNIVTRYGNVLASRGSVIPMFVKSLLEKKNVSITDPRMTRFFITIEQAARFVVNAANDPIGGLKIPEMKAANMVDVARAIGDIMGRTEIGIDETGMRLGEKIYECLKTPYEGAGGIYSNTATRYTKDELRNLLKPIVESLA